VPLSPAPPSLPVPMIPASMITRAPLAHDPPPPPPHHTGRETARQRGPSAALTACARCARRAAHTPGRHRATGARSFTPSRPDPAAQHREHGLGGLGALHAAQGSCQPKGVGLTWEVQRRAQARAHGCATGAERGIGGGQQMLWEGGITGLPERCHSLQISRSGRCRAPPASCTRQGVGGRRGPRRKRGGRGREREREREAGGQCRPRFPGAQRPCGKAFVQRERAAGGEPATSVLKARSAGGGRWAAAGRTGPLAGKERRAPQGPPMQARSQSAAASGAGRARRPPRKTGADADAGC
jgi:hypothetical protein